jgi:hypothetical protein
MPGYLEVESLRHYKEKKYGRNAHAKQTQIQEIDRITAYGDDGLGAVRGNGDGGIC